MGAKATEPRYRFGRWVAIIALSLSFSQSWACSAPGGPGSASDFNWGNPKPSEPNAFPPFGG